MAIVTISRGSKSGGVKLAEILGDRLGAVVISREMLIESAREWGFSDKFWTEINEGRLPRFSKRQTPQHRQYLLFLQIKLLEYAEAGSVVYHGNAGQFLLGNLPCVLRVKLIAPLETRIQTIMELKRVSRADATAYLTRLDDNRLKWMKFLYGIDWNDPSLFDLVINLGRVTLENACELIALTTTHDQFRTDEGCLSIIRNASLEARISAALASNPRTQSLRLLIQADTGVVKLSGVVEAQRVRMVVLDLAHNVEGVKVIHDEMAVKKLSPLPTQGQI